MLGIRDVVDYEGDSSLVRAGASLGLRVVLERYSPTMLYTLELSIDADEQRLAVLRLFALIGTYIVIGLDSSCRPAAAIRSEGIVAPADVEDCAWYV